MARKKMDCGECGAEYSITTKEVEDPIFCPFCGDGTANAVIADRVDDEDEDEEDEDTDDGY